MLVSLDWLNDYVQIDIDVDKLAERFAMSGLNHESTTIAGDDKVLDLEVTSNRGDALGHIGVAREAAVLLGKTLCIPDVKLSGKGPFAAKSPTLAVENVMPEGCDRYTARVIRGVKVGPSPAWLVNRLKAVNIATVNNIVDVTNYVMMECGQPLHAFDASKVNGGKIVVRPGRKQEKFLAIDHREYELNEQTVTIADAGGPIAIAGIMGGADSEITESTADVIIEAASFTPLAVRKTARRLKLHSPSSFRFERRVDPLIVDWASRRCCAMILELAGGKLEATPLQTSAAVYDPPLVKLRQSQVQRVLGIDVPWEASKKILTALGCVEQPSSKTQAEGNASAEFAIPSHRGDLPREIDLIEEVARIWGYDKISEQAIVPTFPSAKRDKDVMLDRLRTILVGCGYNEILTPSCVRENVSQLMSPWQSGAALRTITPMLEGASILRQSLVPSLLQTRLANQSLHNLEASLFEIATIYLTDEAQDKVYERPVVGFVSGQEYRAAKGMIEEMISRCSPEAKLQWAEWNNDGVDSGSGMQLHLNGLLLGWFGNVSNAVRNKLKLQGAVIAGELDLDVLQQALQVLPQLKPINQHPAIERDLNFVLSESVQWKQLVDIVDQINEPLLQSLQYKETYRDAKRDGADKKRVLVSVVLQSETQTLTTENADAVMQKIIDAIEKQANGKLLGATD